MGLNISKNKENKQLIKNNFINVIKNEDNKDNEYILESNKFKEYNRLDFQHYIIEELFKINKKDFDDIIIKLNNNLEKGINVLDIGCGTGIWCLNMAYTFPSSFFNGYDINNEYPKDIIFPNVNFKNVINNIIFDINNIECLKLIPDNSYDYIFQRFMLIVIKEQNWTKILKEYKRILKPNGYLQLIEQDVNVQNAGPLTKNMMEIIHKMLEKRDINIKIIYNLDEHLKKAGFNLFKKQEKTFNLNDNINSKDYVKECIKSFNNENFNYENIMKEHIKNKSYLIYYNYIISNF